MNKKYAIISLFAVAATVIYLLWPSDESRIKKLFKEGAVATEKEDLEALMSKVSFSYRDEYGMSYLYIKDIMKSFFQKADHIKIEYENLKINVANGTATAEADIGIIATIGPDTGYILGDAAKPAHLKFTLEKERTKWLVMKTEGLPFGY